VRPVFYLRGLAKIVLRGLANGTLVNGPAVGAPDIRSVMPAVPCGRTPSGFGTSTKAGGRVRENRELKSPNHDIS